MKNGWQSADVVLFKVTYISNCAVCIPSSGHRLFVDGGWCSVYRHCVKRVSWKTKLATPTPNMIRLDCSPKSNPWS